MDGITPKPTTRDVWYALAGSMIDGDARAVEAGYPAMQNPSARELKELLDKARAERDDISGADREYDKAQESVEELRAFIYNRSDGVPNTRPNAFGFRYSL